MSQEVVEYQEHPSFIELIPRVKEYVELKGLDWAIAALVHGSVGYHTYRSAKKVSSHDAMTREINISNLYMVLFI
jgi:hypothetical protein